MRTLINSDGGRKYPFCVGFNASYPTKLHDIFTPSWLAFTRFKRLSKIDITASSFRGIWDASLEVEKAL
jgi:hypothetical protein